MSKIDKGALIQVLNQLQQDEPVSLEIAKTLKTLGFKEPCRYYHQTIDVPFVKAGLYKVKDRDKPFNHNRYKHYYSAPTKEQAILWLKEDKAVFDWSSEKTLEDYCGYCPNNHFGSCNGECFTRKDLGEEKLLQNKLDHLKKEITKIPGLIKKLKARERLMKQELKSLSEIHPSERVT